MKCAHFTCHSCPEEETPLVKALKQKVSELEYEIERLSRILDSNEREIERLESGWTGLDD